jgi:MFS family permease
MGVGVGEVEAVSAAPAPRSGAIRRIATAPFVALRATAADPPLLRVQISWALVMTATWTSTVALMVLAFDVGGATAVAVAMLLRNVPAAILAPIVGSMGDRRARPRVMATAGAVAAVAATISAAAATDGAPVLPLAVGMGVVLVVANMAFRISHSAVLPDLATTPRALTSANVVTSAIEAVGAFAGPALSAVLVAVGGPTTAFGVAASLFVLSVPPLLGVPATSRSADLAGEPRRRWWQRRGANLASEVLRERGVRLVLVLLFAQTVVSGGLTVLYASIALDLLPLSGSGVGALTAAFGLGGVLGSLALFSLLGSARLGAAVAGGLVLWALPLALIPLLPQVAPVLMLLGLVGAGNALFDVAVVTMLQRLVPVHLLGRAFGHLETTVVVGLAIGAAIAAPVIAVLGPGGAAAAFGIPLLVVAVAAVPSLTRLDAAATAPTERIALLRAMPTFALLPVPELERLALDLQLERFDPGSVVIRQGDTGFTYHVIEQGEVVVTVDDRPVATLGPGDGFGEIALLSDVPRTATVTATTPARIYALDSASFLAAMRSGATLG